MCEGVQEGYKNAVTHGAGEWTTYKEGHVMKHTLINNGHGSRNVQEYDQQPSTSALR